AGNRANGPPGVVVNHFDRRDRGRTIAVLHVAHPHILANFEIGQGDSFPGVVVGGVAVYGGGNNDHVAALEGNSIAVKAADRAFQALARSPATRFTRSAAGATSTARPRAGWTAGLVGLGVLPVRGRSSVTT